MPISKIVLAEDEAGSRMLLAEALAERGIEVIQAEDGFQALDALRDNSGVTLLLTDVRMPRMSGYELAQMALSRNPDLKILVISGCLGEMPPPAVLMAREVRVQPKPFELDKVCGLVLEMLSRP